MWDAASSWEEAELNWEKRAEEASKELPLKLLKNPPEMVGISEETAKNLKWKSFKWILTQDKQKEVRKGFFKHPFKYGLRYLKSLFKAKSFHREGDFYYYGIPGLADFEDLMEHPDTILVAGFSYCHKPLECPSKRFTPDCIHDSTNPVCQQCFIGKLHHALPQKVITLIIPTVHYIGGKMFEITHKFPKKQVLFLITACEMTLEMFGDWGNMVGIKGIGVRLGGRICNTMRAFELSEQGIKPGLTIVKEPTQEKILDLIKKLRASAQKSPGSDQTGPK